MANDADGTEVLLDGAIAGDRRALAELFERHRGRLEVMVRLRLDRRLQGRLDPADVLQEAYLDVARRFPEYAAEGPCRSTSGSGFSRGRSSPNSTAGTWGRKCVTPAWRCRSPAARCRGRRRRHWPKC